MNLALLEQKLKAKISKLYLSKHPSNGVVIDVPNFDSDMKRLRDFQRRLRDHLELMTRRAKVIEARGRAMTDLVAYGKELTSGKRFLAIDVERAKTDGHIQEVGLTSYQKGEIVSVNLRVAGSLKRREGFAFGDSQVMTLDEVKARVMSEAERADYYVGHSLQVDWDTMKSSGMVLPFRPFADSIWLSTLTDTPGCSLGEMCAKFGVDASRPHNGGNDARYNMELLLAMVDKLVTNA